MSGNNSYTKGHSVTLKNHDYRRQKNEEDNPAPINRKVSGYTPTVRKLKPAGKCSEGLPLYFVNGGDSPEHVLTPADDTQVREHKLQCQG